MIKLYGIRNCDSVKKAVKQLQNNGISFDFIDLKTTKLPADLLVDWLQQLPDTLVNKRSAAYRQIKHQWLQAAQQSEQISLIQSHPNLLKRPVIVSTDGVVSVGFDKQILQRLEQ